ncbi:hypothetical protein J4Q44_G00084420 [Coregonus suidteri]|uniref:Uncharacterized protein n=1 Tax=Coregonus suidteri TaxID=861788 RepID=A0AAN8N2C4_9TELE
MALAWQDKTVVPDLFGGGSTSHPITKNMGTSCPLGKSPYPRSLVSLFSSVQHHYVRSRSTYVILYNAELTAHCNI